MLWSGYNFAAREIVANRILAKYHSTVTNYVIFGRPLFRSKEERRSLPKKDKSDWFRDDGTTATLAVPTTEGSTLAKTLRKTLIDFPGPKGTKVRIVETPGPPIQQGISINNPFKLDTCGRTNCPFNTHGENCKERCRIERIVYRAICTRCTETEHCYEGETSRTLLTRSLQHFNEYKQAARSNSIRDSNRDELSSWMWEHVRDKHEGNLNLQNHLLDFKFTVISSHKDAMERQIKEAIRIKSAIGGTVKKSDSSKEKSKVICLNRKGEYFAPIERYEKD